MRRTAPVSAPKTESFRREPGAIGQNSCQPEGLQPESALAALLVLAIERLLPSPGALPSPILAATHACFVMLGTLGVMRKAGSQRAIADDADGNAFDFERRTAQIDFDDFEIRILGYELHLVAPALETLDRDFVVQPRHDHLARARFMRAVHSEQIAVEDAGIAHAQSAHLQQV